MAYELFVSSHQQLASLRVETCLVQSTASSEGGIPDEDWREYIDYMKRVGKEGPIITLLQYSPDVAPSAKQRSEMGGLSEVFAPKLAGVAICTDSMMVRGVITAIQWILRSKNQSKGFKPSEYEQGFAWLNQFGEFDVAEAERALAVVTKRMGFELHK